LTKYKKWSTIKGRIQNGILVIYQGKSNNRSDFNQRGKSGHLSANKAENVMGNSHPGYNLRGANSDVLTRER